jgi:hypothetical protein
MDGTWVRRQKAKVLYAYTAKQPGELNLKIADQVKIHSLVVDGWYKGSVNGKTGVFPSRCVLLLTEDGQETVVPGGRQSSLSDGKPVATRKIQQLVNPEPQQVKAVEHKASRDSATATAFPEPPVALGAASLQPPTDIGTTTADSSPDMSILSSIKSEVKSLRKEMERLNSQVNALTAKLNTVQKAHGDEVTSLRKEMEQQRIRHDSQIQKLSANVSEVDEACGDLHAVVQKHKRILSVMVGNYSCA